MKRNLLVVLRHSLILLMSPGILLMVLGVILIPLYPGVILTVTVDILVRPITCYPGVKKTRAAVTFETLLVPDLAFGKHLQRDKIGNIKLRIRLCSCEHITVKLYLIRMIDKTFTARTAFTLRGLQTVRRGFVVTVPGHIVT